MKTASASDHLEELSIDALWPDGLVEMSISIDRGSDYSYIFGFGLNYASE